MNTDRIILIVGFITLKLPWVTKRRRVRRNPSAPRPTFPEFPGY
jgi:hypothetical protein